jgi:hypothetical protein
MAGKDELRQKARHNEENHRKVQSGTGQDYSQKDFFKVTKHSRNLSHQQPNKRTRDHSAGPNEHFTSQSARMHNEKETHRETHD